MFGFLSMMDNYEDRKVDHYEKDGLMVDTVAVTDSDQPYETAVEHPSYNEGKMVIVELYDTIEDAQTGHDKWVETMTAEKLPQVLDDVSTCDVVKFAASVGENIIGPREKAAD